MANYVPLFRSNYFRVKDIDAWKTFVDKLGEYKVIEGNEDRVGLLSEGETGFPTQIYDEDDHDYTSEIDFAAEVASHLVHGEVAIFMEIGYEKMRYLFGAYWAVNWEGKVLQGSLDEVYDRVTLHWGVKPTMAAY